jgi:hypothetical protein
MLWPQGGHAPFAHDQTDHRDDGEQGGNEDDLKNGKADGQPFDDGVAAREDREGKQRERDGTRDAIASRRADGRRGDDRSPEYRVAVRT